MVKVDKTMDLPEYHIPRAYHVSDSLEDFANAGMKIKFQSAVNRGQLNQQILKIVQLSWKPFQTLYRYLWVL